MGDERLLTTEGLQLEDARNVRQDWGRGSLICRQKVGDGGGACALKSVRPQLHDGDGANQQAFLGIRAGRCIMQLIAGGMRGRHRKWRRLAVTMGSGRGVI